MIQQFLQFVTAVLLVAIFWELCKINGQPMETESAYEDNGVTKD